MPTLASDLIQQTRGYLLSSRREQQNVLSTAYTAGGTTLVFQYPIDGMAKGAYISVGLEVFQVFDTNPGAQSVTVLGAQQGSVAANHADGSLTYVNPEFTDFAILREINNDLDDLSSPIHGLYQVKTVAFDYNSAVQGYNLAADVDEILEVKYQDDGPEALWPLIPRRQYTLKRDMNTADFASAAAIVIYGVANPGRPIRVTYKAPFTQLSTLADVVTTVTGLAESACDLPSLGAAKRLVGMQEIKRNLTGAQGDTRRANEVPAGAATGAARWLEAERRQRIIAESARLARRYPLRRRGR